MPAPKNFTPAEQARIIRLYLGGCSCQQIGLVLRCSGQTIYHFVRWQGVNRNRRQAARHRQHQLPSYEPTEEQIALEAARIRNGWSDEEARARAGLPRKQEPYQPPMIQIKGRHNGLPTFGVY